MRFFCKLHNSRENMALKLTVSYSFLLILILLISIYFYQISKNDIQESLENRTKAQLSSSMAALDDDLSGMRGLALSFAQNQEITALAWSSPDASDQFFFDSYRTQQILSAYVPVERLLPITFYFVYFPKSNYALTTGNFSTMDLFYTREGMRSEHYGEWLDMISNPDNYTTFVPLSRYKPSDEDYLYLLPLDNYVFHHIPAQLGFFIDKNKLEQHFSALFFQQNGFLYVADNEGVCQFCLGDPLPGDFQPETLASLSYRNNVASFFLSGKNITAIQYISNSNKWQYYYITPPEALQNSLRQYQNMYLLVTGASLLASFLLIYFLSKRNTRPYIQLGNQLKDSLSHSQQLESALKKQQPIIRNSYIRNIMLGRISSMDEMDYIKECLNLTKTNVSYYVLYIVIYPNEQQPEAEMPGDEPAAEVQSSLYSSAYDANILCCLKKYFGEPLYLFNPKKHNYVILLCEKNDVTCEELSEKTAKTFAAFHEELLENCGIWAMAGMGNLNHLLENTWKSYQQAMESASYASSKHFFRNYSSLDLSSDLYYFPVQLSESLTSFITAGNKSQVEEIFKFIYKENLEKRSLSYQKMKSLLLSIYDTLCRIRYSIPDSNVSEPVRAIDIRLAEYLSLKQLEDVAIGLCDLFKEKSSQKQTMLSIQSYIQKNYRDASLCLTKLSDEFKLSESYLSYLFKKRTGNNFSMYLEHIRMQEARKLVMKSDISLSDIYREVGYNNANSFRRVFKKSYGVSAKAMRDSLKSSAVSEV